MADSDDPFLPSDLTARPRPGAGRRGMPDSGMYQRPAMPRVAEVEPIPESARAFLGLGLNPLVQAASPLLLRMGQMRNAPASLDVPSLRRAALDEIRRFEERARASGVRNEIVLAARYVLCAGLDEAVLSTPCGLRRANGRSIRSWSRCTARRGAARSSSRCSIGSSSIRRGTSI